MPAWHAAGHPLSVFLCFDTSAVDDRIFTRASPAYVSRRHLLHLASLSGERDIDIHIGDDPVPIGDEGQFQVEDGDTFVFAPSGTVIPTMHSLSIDLFSGQAWSHALTAPIASSEGMYCLVHEADTVRYHTRFLQPTAFRQHIAACVGINLQHLRIFPSSPRIADATVDGFPCRTVIAVCDLPAASDDLSFGVLVDARAALLGWRTFSAVAGRVSCIRIRVELQRDAPAGWRIYIKDVAADTDFLTVRAGQVLVAALAPAVEHFAAAPSPVDAQTEGRSTSEAQGGSSGPDFESRSPGQRDDAGDGASDDGGLLAQDGGTGHDTEQTVEQVYALCSFLLLGQNYIAEHIEIRLPVGIDVGDAINRVSAARAPSDTTRLPGVHNVHPQPNGTHALCVTTPAWDSPGAVVAIDSRDINGRLFAIHLVGSIDRLGLLNVAQIPHDGVVDVYIGSQPWPLVDGPSVNLLTGELVLFVRPQAPYHSIASLQDMLASDRGWDPAFDPSQHIYGGYTAHTWLMSDFANGFFVLQPERRHQARQDIASFLEVSSRELAFQVAHLDSHDFAYKGVATRTVLAALRSTEFLPSLRTRPAICFIDARPVLLNLTWQVCPDELLDAVSLVSRFAGYCPAGFVVCVCRSNFVPVPLGSNIAVQAGEVFTVLFWPSRVQPHSHPYYPDEPDDGDDGDEHSDSADEGYNPPADPTSAHVVSRPFTSDTGGTSGSSHNHADHPVFLSTVKWFTILKHLAEHAGKWWITTVKAETRIAGVDSAVCGSAPLCYGGVRERLANPYEAGTHIRTLDPNHGSNPIDLPVSGELLHSVGKCAFALLDEAYPCRRQKDTPAILCDSPTGGARSSGSGDCDDRHSRRASSGVTEIALSATGHSHALQGRPPGLLWLSWLLWICSASPATAVTQQEGAVSFDGRSDVCFSHPAICGRRSGTRPVATPARTSWVPHFPVADPVFIEDDIAIGPFVTLLEQSVAQPTSEAFFLARSLLETLWEHFVGRTTPSTTGLPTPLQLSAALPRQVEYDVSCVSLRNPLSFEQVAEFLACAWDLPHDIPPCLELHKATRQAFDQHISFVDGCNTGISSISVYTDGSYNGQVSYWAFAAVAHCSHGAFLFAWAKGRVRLVGQEWFIGAPDHSALSAERSAVFWATAWLFGVNRQIACTIHCDCLVAAYQANGKFGDASASNFATTCRSLVQALESRGNFHAASIMHVRGHQGHLYNELADTVAGASQVADTDLPAVYAHLCKWAEKGDLSWLWLSVAALGQPNYWPDIKGHSFADPHGNKTLGEPLRPQDFFGAQITDTPRKDRTKVDFVLEGLLVSVNVQSLCEDDSSSLPNRTPFVREQLQGIGCAVTGLQETRAKHTSTVVSSSHIRFLSGCDSKGCLGVELWFSRTVAFGWQGSIPIYFSIEDFRVLHWTPRILLVRFVRGGLRILFVTCHAPTAVSPERDAWWKGFVDLLLHVIHDDKVVILGDLNARLCDPLRGRVGDLVWEQEHRPPSPFFRMLQALDLWVPSTFYDRHCGMSHTWCAPGGTATSRIDFILIPAHWGVPAGGSSVLYNVDFGQSGLDHFAVQLCIQVTFTAKPAFSASKRRFDCAKAMQPEAAPILQGIFDSAPAVPWAIDAHQHYHAVASHVLAGLSRHFPATHGVRRRAFFSDTTWSLRQQRLWLRRQAHRASVALGSWELHCAFCAWQGWCTLQSALGSCIGIVFSTIARLRQAVADLRAIKPLFRRALRQDKGTYLSEIATQAATSTTKDVVQRLRPLLGPPRRKQRGVAPLPVVKLEDGTFANTPEEANARWLRHFSAAEQGGPISPEVLIAKCYARQKAADLDAVDICGCDLPSQYDLETAFRFSQPGKAAGNDGMPPDILHCYPGPVAKLFYPVLLKVAFRLQEPLQFKGGSVSHIYKCKGDIADCTNHRGILISNNVGRVSIVHSGKNAESGTTLLPRHFKLVVVKAFQ